MSLIDKIEREKVMKVAFLNLCHCDPMIVERVARKLTASPAFDMYIHVDAKQDEVPFRKRLNNRYTYRGKRCIGVDTMQYWQR